ncbi:MAG: hypothetical protein Q8O59_03820 [bacterium]|nr:hypothetical protein [bacterium]
MKILVIDDSVKNQEAAKKQLSGHDLTVVGSYDEGNNKISRRNEFEAVLVDLLMPASDYAQGREGQKYVGQEMPIGIFLALSAAFNGGAKYVGLLTDTDHHQHPASACVDALNRGQWGEGEPCPHVIGGAKVVFSNNRSWIVNGEKNWAALLEYVIECGEAPKNPRGHASEA